ncbi:MAG: class I SAM-dependent methyltransferase, partial [Caldilinea sp.]
MQNIDPKTVNDFGNEWTEFDQQKLTGQELHRQFEQYFKIFPWEKLPQNAGGFDMGCGSGRWARIVASRVGELHCIDASPKALEVAKKNLALVSNCCFHQASFEEIPLADNSMDFGYSLGVLHHIPDTFQGVQSCVG